MSKIDLTLNVTQEDFQNNDYLFAWQFFKKRPSKICFYDNFSLDKFSELINSYKFTNVSSLTEIYPYEKHTLTSTKNFVNLDDTIFVSYTLIDTENDSIINDVFVYYSDDNSEFLELFLKKLNDSIEDFPGLDSPNTHIIKFENLTFEKESINFIDLDLDNFDLYYNDDTISKITKLSKNLVKNSKGLTIIYGERGVGKTSLMTHLSKNVEKNFLFLPSNLFENSIINSEFRNFLNKNSNSVLILDDSDIYFSETYSKSNIFSNNMLQLVDGIDSDNLNLHIIAILNTNNVDNIDHVLMECNNLIDAIHIDELDVKKIKNLCKHLKTKNKFSDSTKLINVLKKKKSIEIDKEIGFH